MPIIVVDGALPLMFRASMKNIANYQQSIHNQRVSKRISSLERAGDISERTADIASNGAFEGESPSNSDLPQPSPIVDGTLRKFVNRSTVADLATDGSVVLNESNGIHWQQVDTTRNIETFANANPDRLEDDGSMQLQTTTVSGAAHRVVVGTATMSSVGVSQGSVAHQTSVSSNITASSPAQPSPIARSVPSATKTLRGPVAQPAQSQVVNSDRPIPIPVEQQQPLLVTGHGSVEGTVGIFGRLAQSILNWYKPIEMSFVCAVCVMLIVFSYVMHPHSAFISNTIQPAFFSLPAAPISSLEYTILPAITEESIQQPTADIYTPYLPVAFQEFTVEAGQTLSQLAELHGVSMSTLASYNDISNARSLRAGQSYRVPDREGLLIEPSANDTVYAIAQRYSVSPEAILDANDLEILELSSSDQLFVPGASLSDFDLRLVIGDLFVFPVRGRLTSGYGYRNDPFTGVRRFHYGLDIASYTGAPIGAAMEGRVSYVGEQRGGYGKYVIVRHPGGFQTLYAHLSTISVSNGQYVSRGQRVGRMGNTGRSTGPHLHFSIIKNGTFVNPALYLY